MKQSFSFSEELIQALMRAAQEGHLCIRRTEQEKNNERLSSDLLIDEVRNSFGIESFSELKNRESPSIFPLKPIIRDAERFYLHRNWMIETVLLHHFQRLLRTKKEVLSVLKIDPALSLEQKKVIEWAASHSITLVRGGPGTGKTFTAAALVKALATEQSRIKVAAPTGKAADRLGQDLPQNLDIETTTLHRLLSLSPGRNRIFEKTSLRADLILVDEASMIDASLFAHLFAATPGSARLVLLGDADQLPPVQGGGVFSDLCAVSSLSLQQCHRTQTLQELYEAARIGDIAPLLPFLEPFPKDLITWVNAHLKKGGRILCPLRQGDMGVDAINRALLRYRGKEGAPLLITGNDLKQKLYNGTEGMIYGDYAQFSDGRLIPLTELPSYEVAFALSIHKSQGSEYEEVLCLLPPGSEEFGRKALYTAVTRAKKSVRFLGSKKTLELMIEKESRQENGICERIKRFSCEREGATSFELPC